MRVGLDYLPAVQHAPGLGRYARELVRALVRLPDAPELALFEVGRGPRRFAGAALGLEGARARRLSLRLPQRAPHLVRALTGLGAERWLGGVDLFHRVRPHTPPLGARTPELLPVPELPRPGTPADAALGTALRRAGNALVFCSAYRSRLVERYGVDPARIFQAPVGCDHWRRDLGAAALDAASVEPARVLVLGALRAERQPVLALEAFELLRARGVDAELVLVGGPGSAADAFERRRASSAARASVRWRPDVAELELPELVARSSVLLHLAEDEGTAVTPLEAFSLGVGVVATRLPAFEEALEGRARLLAPDAPAQLVADELAAALAAVPERAAAAERQRVAAGHTWANDARATLAAWRGILDPADGGAAHQRA